MQKIKLFHFLGTIFYFVCFVAVVVGCRIIKNEKRRVWHVLYICSLTVSVSLVLILEYSLQIKLATPYPIMYTHNSNNNNEKNEEREKKRKIGVKYGWRTIIIPKYGLNLQNTHNQIKWKQFAYLLNIKKK